MNSASTRLSEVVLPNGVKVEEGSRFIARGSMSYSGGSHMVMEKGDVIQVTGIAYSPDHESILLTISGAGIDVIELGDQSDGFMGLVMKGKLVRITLRN